MVGGIELRATVTDPDVVAELSKYTDVAARERYAVNALRLGVLALRQAAGELDATAIRNAAQDMLTDLGQLLAQRGTETSNAITSALRQYFDPSSGALPQRIEALLRSDGELDRALRAHLGPENSTIANALSAHFGQGSPIFKLLSPTNANGVKAQVQGALEGVLQNQREETLDDDGSALSRLKRELLGTIEELSKSNSSFQTEVRTTLATLQARKEESARSTRHGQTFEESVGLVIAFEAQRLNDPYECTGTTTGAIKNCKTGDFVTTLGPDSAAPGSAVVWEAKEDKSYDLKCALTEIETARKNRQAQIGIFVFSKSTAPEGLQPFARYGRDIVITWDAENSSSDLNLRIAYSVARALAIRESHESVESEQALHAIDLATRAIEKQIDHLDQIRIWAETVRSNGDKVAERAARMRDDLAREVEALDRQISGLKVGGLRAA